MDPKFAALVDTLAPEGQYLLAISKTWPKTGHDQ
jgi:hypothetical protein